MYDSLAKLKNFYFWGISLDEAHDEFEWDGSTKENSDGLSLTKHTLCVRQAILGPDAKEDEVNVLEVESFGFRKQKYKLPISVLYTDSGARAAKTKLVLKNQFAIFRLVKGSGPLHIIGSHQTEIIRFNDFIPPGKVENEDDDDDKDEIDEDDYDKEVDDDGNKVIDDDYEKIDYDEDVDDKDNNEEDSYEEDNDDINNYAKDDDDEDDDDEDDEDEEIKNESLMKKSKRYDESEDDDVDDEDNEDNDEDGYDDKNYDDENTDDEEDENEENKYEPPKKKAKR